jgi:hypothetical protein
MTVGPDALFDAAGYRSGPMDLADRFVVPPFSVLRMDGGTWQTRRRQWLSTGIESEVGRDATTYNSSQYLSGDNYNGLGAGFVSDTSIFCPTLCEVVYRWWSPPAGRVLDPFAGGSVRGVVAAAMGRSYVGLELRDEQVAANRAQWPEVRDNLGAGGHPPPQWLVGDAARMGDHTAVTDAPFDLVFTCPPYYDLEVYSDDPADISGMGWDQFEVTYTRILTKAVDRLADDRFAVIVIGDVRDKAGNLRNLQGLTVNAMEQAGASFYNDVVVTTPAGTVPVRLSAAFEPGRKVGRIHQYALVFVKGSWKAAVAACGPAGATYQDEAV